MGYSLEIVINEYAKDRYGNQMYPKDENEHEYMHHDMLIGDRYPMFKSGLPRYRKDENGNEFYESKEGHYIFGKDVNGNECYAQDIENNQIYPPDYSIAKKNSSTYFYAVDKNGKTIFPKDRVGNEYYIPDDTSDRYARDYYGNEIYPILHKHERVLNGKYAVDSGNVPFYPKDKYDNEYYLSTDILSRYAVTWDNKVIVPEKNELPYIHEFLEPAITPKNVLGRLLRSSRYEKDYVTDVVLTYIKLPETGKNYTYRSKTNDLIVIVPRVSTPAKSTTQCSLS